MPYRSTISSCWWTSKACRPVVCTNISSRKPPKHSVVHVQHTDYWCGSVCKFRILVRSVSVWFALRPLFSRANVSGLPRFALVSYRSTVGVGALGGRSISALNIPSVFVCSVWVCYFLRSVLFFCRQFEFIQFTYWFTSTIACASWTIFGYAECTIGIFPGLTRSPFTIGIRRIFKCTARWIFSLHRRLFRWCSSFAFLVRFDFNAISSPIYSISFTVHGVVFVCGKLFRRFFPCVRR